MLNLTDQIVAVLGAGRSGQAAAALAAHCGAQVTVYDSRKVDGAVQACPEKAREIQSDLVIVSPGIETQGDFVQSFVQGTGALWGEVELAWRCYQGTVFGITGTNGKTTTTELVDELVRASGRTCVPCGNYGVPFSEVVMGEDVPEVVALELSSFQLETTVDFTPDAIIWLNFSPDHMDRYHSVDEYRAAKLRIFEKATASTPVIVRAGEELGNVPGKRTEFSSAEGPIPLKKTRLRGLHNVENLNAATLAVTALFGAPEIDALQDYQPPAHRCELIRKVRGVEYVNDSKATNLHALESALRSQTEATVLLAGGKQKGLDYRPLLPLLKEKVAYAVFFGEIGPDLFELFKTGVPSEAVETLQEAVLVAQREAQSGATVLLSPGTSSFDQFRSYEDRGEAFRKAVLALS